MFTPRRLSASCFLILCLLATVLAQGEQPGKAEGTIIHSGPTVTAAATADRVRFTAPNTVVQMHLQVYDNNGQLVFDVSSKGNVLDWTLQNGGGGRLISGSYISVVTVKSLSGKLSQRIGSVSVQEKQTELLQADAAQITIAQQQAIGPVEENAALTILKAGETEATTVVAHDGTQGEVTRSRGALSFRLGDFFSGNDKEQMRLTEEGNLGIGTDNPQAKLDVAGVIRTSKGIEFANSTDGTGTNVTKLTATASGTLQQTLANGTVVTSATGTGTQDRLAKWAETGGAGTLTDSVIRETGGKVGVGVNNPTYRLVVGPDIGPGLTTSDLTVSRGPGQSVSIYAGATGAHGMNFGWDEANLRAFVNAPVESPITFTHGGVSERMRIDTAGNVGIGTTAPSATLHVVAYTNSAGENTATFQAPNIGSNQSHIHYGTTGDWYLRSAASAGKVVLQDSGGNVGIGTGSPAAKLDVRDGTGTFSSGGHIQVGAPVSNADEKIIVFGNSACGFGSSPCVSIGEQDAHGRMVLRANEVRFKAGSVLPDSDDSQFLGFTSNRWKEVWAVNGTIQTSDVRLKQGIANLNYGLSQVMQLRPVSFQWKEGNDKRTHLGLIAQEVDAVMPEAVEKSADANAPLGMNYSTLIPVLIKAIQEQQGTLERAQAEIKTLRTENEALSKRIIFHRGDSGGIDEESSATTERTGNCSKMLVKHAAAALSQPGLRRKH